MTKTIEYIESKEGNCPLVFISGHDGKWYLEGYHHSSSGEWCRGPPRDKFVNKIMLSNTAKKHLFYLVCLVLVIFYSYLLVFGDGGMLRLRQEEQKLMEASKLRNEELKESQELQKKIDMIKNDQREVERIARERYKMALTGEIIVTIDE